MSQVKDEDVVEIWKKVVDVQQHFNDLCLRVRNLAVVSVGAILTAGAFAVKDGVVISLLSVDYPAAIPILIIALVTWGAFFLIDYLWYHRLLIGAVLHGEMIETRHKDRIPEIGLALAISKNSPVDFLFWKQLRSTTRLQYFYGIGAGLLVFLMFPFLPQVQYSKNDGPERPAVKKRVDKNVYRDRGELQGRITIPVSWHYK